MLNIKIFDVDHGFCAAVNANDHHRILIDCGYNSRNGFYPTRYFRSISARRLNYLIVPSFIEGSLAGLYDLIQHFPNNCFSIDNLLVNPSIDCDSLPELIVRNFRNRNSLSFLSSVCERCSNVERSIQLGDVKIAFFWNTYPEFLDFNNLSLVTFLSYRDVNIIFPGALMKEGWRALLRNPRFRDHLRQVNFFVTTKHGKVEDYYSNLFSYCNPDLIIISDGDRRSIPTTSVHQYISQIRAAYTSSGRPRILTTRKAGTITLQQTTNEPMQLITQRFKAYQLNQTEVYRN